jgi:hypothetical protein
MTESSETPGKRPPGTTSSSQSPTTAFFEALFRRVEAIYILGGFALVLIGSGSAEHSTNAGSGFAGLGLCVAGGLCFIAAAIVRHGSLQVGRREEQR